jgi:hypothetical protein
MKFSVVALTTLVTTLGLAVPGMAQIRNPSQDFFDQGRERLEREIQVLQSEPTNSEQSQKKPQSEPLLEVSPDVGGDRIGPLNDLKKPNVKPGEVETPQSQPNPLHKS